MGQETDTTSLPEQPKAPNPSSDSGVIPRIATPPADPSATSLTDTDLDVATLDPLIALKLLANGVQALSEITGEVLPSPAISRPTAPAIVELRGQLVRRPSMPGTPPSSVPSDDLKSPAFQNVQIGSPEALLSEPTVVVEGPTRKDREQIDTISRKFYSKRPPPISIEDYLLRLHRYCPMSTAVYLAAAVYIYRMAVEDRSVPVTVRTVHRLLLGSLRIAMKALEDLSYPHQRFAGVGGVSEKELAKLEISVCYLTNFDLKVDNAMLQSKIRSLQRVSVRPKANLSNFTLNLPTRVRQTVEAV